MPRMAAGLSAVKVRSAAPGRYGDGKGLYLLVRGPKARFWVFRYRRDGRMREMGLAALLTCHWLKPASKLISCTGR